MIFEVTERQILSLCFKNPKSTIHSPPPVENKNHHKRDHHVWQEDRHRHRRGNIAMNLALTRNALLAIIPFTEKKNLPALVEEYRDHKQLAINLVLNAHPFP